MIRKLMPEDSHLLSLKKAISLIEEVLRIVVKLKDPSISNKEKKALRDKYPPLLNEAGSELKKSANPELMPEEERKYFKELYVSYFEELEREVEKLANIKVKRVSKTKNKPTLETFELPVETDEVIKKWFWLLSKNSYKEFKRLKYLSHLEFNTKEENEETKLRVVMGAFYWYLISCFITLKFELINTTEKRNQELIQKELVTKELLIQQQELINSLLDKIIELSLQLKDKNLTDWQRILKKTEQKAYRNTLNEFRNSIHERTFLSSIALKAELYTFEIKKNQFREVLRQSEKHYTKMMRDFDNLMSLGRRRNN